MLKHCKTNLRQGGKSSCFVLKRSRNIPFKSKAKDGIVPDSPLCRCLIVLVLPKGIQYALNKLWRGLNFKGRVHTYGMDCELRSDCLCMQSQSWNPEAVAGKIAHLPCITWRTQRSKMNSQRCNE